MTGTWLLVAAVCILAVTSIYWLAISIALTRENDVLAATLAATIQERDIALDGASADVIAKAWRVSDLAAELEQAQTDLELARRTVVKVLEHHDRRRDTP